MRKLLWRFLRSLLFLLDAERAHLMTISMIRFGIRLGGWPLRLASGAPRIPRISAADQSHVEPHAESYADGPVVFGMPFLGRVGLAAGFDKNAEVVKGLPALGFGFAEIGTVTPLPQPGNGRPRLYRDPAKFAVFNRMGFNGEGAGAVSRNLEQTRKFLPTEFRVGVNIGKNKDTPQERAAEDYATAIAPFEGLADYVVINVSSPNTPGLRDLQTVEALKPIVEGVVNVISRWKARPPLLLKLAPELDGEPLIELIQACESMGTEGWVLTNTLGGTWRFSGQSHDLPGGWSGLPVRERSLSSLRTARAVTRLPIISVGGILNEDHAEERIRLGADLIQVYSGWIFAGPTFPADLSRRIR